MTFAERTMDDIMMYMCDHGIKQRDLAERMGLSQPRISQLLNRKRNLTLDMVSRIWIALGRDFA